jgi:hypothetical protein
MHLLCGYWAELAKVAHRLAPALAKNAPQVPCINTILKSTVREKLLRGLKDCKGLAAATMSGFIEDLSWRFGSHTDVPAYDVTSGECYVSDMVRDEVHFSCDRSAAHTKKRLCWCESAIASSNDVADKAQAEGDDEIGTDVIIWIVIGNMVFLGILAVCCGLTCKLMQRCRGASETPPGEVASTFVRCPACGVPLERSASPSTAPAKRMPSKPATTKSSLGLRHGDEDTISNRTSQTVKFQDVVFDSDMSVSDVSKSANAV